MQILILSGNQDRFDPISQAINAMCKGIDDTGGKFEVLFLNEFKLEDCRRCYVYGAGICQNEPRCIIEDDLDLIIKKIKAADILVFATPFQYGHLSNSSRIFFNRFSRMSNSLTSENVSNIESQNRSFVQGRVPALGYCYASRDGNETITGASVLERILETCGFYVIGVIPACPNNLGTKLTLLESIGKWLITKPLSGTLTS